MPCWCGVERWPETDAVVKDDWLKQRPDAASSSAQYYWTAFSIGTVHLTQFSLEAVCCWSAVSVPRLRLQYDLLLTVNHPKWEIIKKFRLYRKPADAVTLNHAQSMIYRPYPYEWLWKRLFLRRDDIVMAWLRGLGNPTKTNRTTYYVPNQGNNTL